MYPFRRHHLQNIDILLKISIVKHPLWFFMIQKMSLFTDFMGTNLSTKKPNL